MRLFTGIALAPHVVSNIAEFMQRVECPEPARWVPMSNLHITTKFIGEWAESRLPELTEALRFHSGKFTATVAGIGFFPNAFWAGVEENPELTALAAATESALGQIGLPKEERPYLPHITLARARASATWRKAIQTSPVTFGTFEVDAFHLYQSRNSIYTSLAAFPLK